MISGRCPNKKLRIFSMDSKNNIVDITEVQKDLNTYYWFDSFFSNSDCDKIVALGKSRELESATVFSGSSSVRKSKVGWIPYDKELDWIYSGITECVSKANEFCGWSIDWEGYEEDLQFSQYNSVGDHYNYHMDIGVNHYHRKISAILQLSDPKEYEGADLLVDAGSNELTCPKERGSVILFPSFLLHKVSPLKSGERNSLVAWASGPNWK
jgi:PKHD-type hydroxylase